jgi:hypothetical protein
MNDPVIERVAREDPATREQIRSRDELAATRARVLAAIDRDHVIDSRSACHRNGIRAGAAAVALIAIVVVVAFVALGHRTHPPRSAPTAHSGHGASASQAKPVGLYAAGAVTVGSSPQALLAHGRFLWVATPSKLVRLNLHNGQTIARTPLPTVGVNAGLAFGAGSVWLAPTGTQLLLRIDSTDNHLVSKIPLGDTDSIGGGVAFADGRVWVSRDSSRPRGDVVAVDPSTSQHVGAPITVGSGPDAIVSGFGSLWVENTSVIVGNHVPPQTYPAMSRIDPRTHHVITEPFAGTPATGFGSLWVQTNAGDDGAAILRVNPATGRRLARIAIPRVVGVAFGGGRVWAISNPKSRSSRTFHPIKGTAALRQINPQTNRMIGKPIHLNMLQPVAIAVSRGQLWIADYHGDKVIHFQLIKP